MVKLLCIQGLQGSRLYLSVSGGLGQLYDIFFVLLARLKGMQVFMHHHSFRYLNMRSLITQILVNIAGLSSIHIVLSVKMSILLTEIYKTSQTIIISNSFFLFKDNISINKTRNKLRTIGFISNISAEKGVFEFLELMALIEAINLPLRGKLAGPFKDSRVKCSVDYRMTQLKKLEYVGPKYNSGKNEFYRQIDALIFPTHYVHEAEPLVVLEAMSHGIPVIAYGRGCIPEIIRGGCGRIVKLKEDFAPSALDQIKIWLSNPIAFEEASKAASLRYSMNYSNSKQQWIGLLNNLIGTSIP